MNARVTTGLLVILATLAPPDVIAHAFPQQSQPAVGSVIKQSPPVVTILFNGFLEPLFNTLLVKDAAGKVVTTEPARVDPDNRMLLEVPLPPLSPGQYHVYWRITSKDGHQTEGDYTFTVSGP